MNVQPKASSDCQLLFLTLNYKPSETVSADSDSDKMKIIQPQSNLGSIDPAEDI